MSFFDHLGELRERILKSFIGMMPGLAIGGIFHETLFGYLIRPFTTAWKKLALPGEPRVLILNPVDAFVVYLKVALVAGVCVGAPWIFLASLDVYRPRSLS